MSLAKQMERCQRMFTALYLVLRKLMFEWELLYSGRMHFVVFLRRESVMKSDQSTAVGCVTLSYGCAFF